MDTKLLSKVPTWNGDEDLWFEWSFAFRAYCVVSGLISTRLLGETSWQTRIAKPDNVHEVLEQPESESVRSSSVAAVISSLTQSSVDWVFEISRVLMPAVRSVYSVNVDLEESYVWLDSACYDHVCGSSFAKDCEIIRDDEFSRRTDIRAANGSTMQHLGVRTVRMQTICDRQNLQITFQVLNVERPLISVGKLAKDGCEIIFDGTGGFIHHEGRRLRFERVGDMFGIRSRVLGNSGDSNFVSGGRNLVMPTFDVSSGLPEVSGKMPMPSFSRETSRWRVERLRFHRFADLW